MSYLNNKQFVELSKAKANGDAKAGVIIEKFMQGGKQDELGRLLDDYYSPKVNQELGEKEEHISLAPAYNEVPDASNIDVVKKVEIGGLDKEFEDLIDKPEIEEMTFSEFLKNKRRDGLRSRKNANYFKAFGEEERANFLNNKEKEFADSLRSRRRDIDRNFKDMDNAIGIYSQSITDLPDDSFEFSEGVTNDVYNKIIDDNENSHSFGRSWDEEDLGEVKNALLELVKQYGKKNVVSALNILRDDNNLYRNHRVNEIDKSISDYNKKMESLLK